MIGARSATAIRCSQISNPSAGAATKPPQHSRSNWPVASAPVAIRRSGSLAANRPIPEKALARAAATSTSAPASPSTRRYSPLTSQRASLQPSPSPTVRRAQQDLTQKLRAMDMALERIEHGNSNLAASSSLNILSEKPQKYKESEDLGEGFDGGTTTASDRETLASSMSVSSHQHGPRPGSLGASTVTLESSHLDDQGEDGLLHDSGGVAKVRAEDWHSAFSTLRAEVSRELGVVRSGEEEQRRNAMKMFTDFELELTEALEARAKETDSLLERRLIEAGEALQRRLAEFETAASADRARISGFESEIRRKLAEMEAASNADRERIAETSQSSREALQKMKDQLATFQCWFQQTQTGLTELQDNLAELRQRFQMGPSKSTASDDLKTRLCKLEQVGTNSMVRRTPWPLHRFYKLVSRNFDVKYLVTSWR